LIDEIGGFEDALGRARMLAGLEDSAEWTRVTPPGSGRPEPGENIVEGLSEVARTAAELKATRAWTMLPYELREER
ncbi:MAG: hypothetical protein L0G70_02030, partial [Rubrobacter sp.]|nr:hypothetical protein [Rubrobacter sp.]